MTGLNKSRTPDKASGMRLFKLYVAALICLVGAGGAYFEPAGASAQMRYAEQSITYIRVGIWKSTVMLVFEEGTGQSLEARYWSIPALKASIVWLACTAAVSREIMFLLTRS